VHIKTTTHVYVPHNLLLCVTVMQYENKHICARVSFLFPTADITKNTQKYHKTYSTLLLEL